MDERAVSAPARANVTQTLNLLYKDGSGPRPHSAQYHQLTRATAIEGSVTIKEMVRALSQVYEAFPILLSYYTSEQGVWEQHIPICSSPEVVIWYGSPDLPATTEAVQEIHDVPIDLSKGPSCKFVLLCRGLFVETLVMKVSHFVCDGFSMAWIGKHIGRLIEKHRKGVNSASGALVETRMEYPPEATACLDVTVDPKVAIQALEVNSKELHEISNRSFADKRSWWEKKLFRVPEQCQAYRPSGDGVLLTSIAPLNHYLGVPEDVSVSSPPIAFPHLVAAAFAKEVNDVIRESELPITFQRFGRKLSDRRTVADLSDMQTLVINTQGGLGDVATCILDAQVEASDYNIPYWLLSRRLDPDGYNRHLAVSPFLFNHNPSFPTKIGFGSVQMEMFPLIIPSNKLSLFAVMCNTFEIRKEDGGTTPYIAISQNSSSSLPEELAHESILRGIQRRLSKSYGIDDSTDALGDAR